MPRIDFGLAALSVDMNKKLHEFFIETSHKFLVAKILFFTAEKIFFSIIFTCLYAAV